jgi:predicted nicotinamide N-methyase
MLKTREKDYTCNGVKVLRSSHRSIRELKRIHKPSIHGFRIWPSSWLLMDYFTRSRFSSQLNIIDIGCGWGIAGIYCVKNFNSVVTCIDSDSAVFPYVHLLAGINDVSVETIEADFSDLEDKDFTGIDVMIGSDICFWDDMVDILTAMMQRALDCGVKTIVFADPGRPSFEKLAEFFMNKGIGKIIDWFITAPYSIQGRILRVGLIQ